MEQDHSDWSTESVPLYKSKEPKGKEFKTANCPLCGVRLVVVEGKIPAHNCKPK